MAHGSPGRRTVLTATGLAATITTLRLPSAAQAATLIDPTADATFESGFALDATLPAVYNRFGFTLTPNITGPSGTGEAPGAGDVRLLAVDVLFQGGNGVKAGVQTPDRDLAVYASASRRQDAAVSEEAVGEIVASWDDATVAGTNGDGWTWVRYSLTAGTVSLDVSTQYFVAMVTNGIVFRDTGDAWAPTALGAWATSPPSGVGFNGIGTLGAVQSEKIAVRAYFAA